VLADALAVVSDSDKPRKAGHWVNKLPNELKALKGRVAERLVERGGAVRAPPQGARALRHRPLARGRSRAGGRAWTALRVDATRTLRERLRAELTGAAELSARTALLAALLRALDLVGTVVAKDERKAANRRAKEIADDPARIGSSVHPAIDATQVASWPRRPPPRSAPDAPASAVSVSGRA